MKDQRSDFVAPLLRSGDGVERKLQALVGCVLIARLPGLVVDNRDRSIGQTIDAVNTARDGGVSDFDLERFLGVQDLRRGNRTSLSQKILQLDKPELFIQLVLVRFLDPCGSQVDAK